VSKWTLDQALPVVQDLAKRKANAFVRRCGFPIDDREDVQSQLLLSIVSRWPKFDSERASVRTFASRLIDKELVSILRYRLASRRRDSFSNAIEEFDDDNGDYASGSHPSPIQRTDFWLDVERALASCPPVLLETAIALCWDSPSELSRTCGPSRTAVYGRIRRLRQAFSAAGIDRDYFVSGGRKR
jgi:DNA-directed RNA polymerase specialized sigma24 family protein